MSFLPLSRVGEREEVANSRVTSTNSRSDHQTSEQKAGASFDEKPGAYGQHLNNVIAAAAP